jgi:hypothetical protein
MIDEHFKFFCFEISKRISKWELSKLKEQQDCYNGNLWSIGKQITYMKITVFWDVMTCGLIDRYQTALQQIPETVIFTFTARRTSSHSYSFIYLTLDIVVGYILVTNQCQIMLMLIFEPQGQCWLGCECTEFLTLQISVFVWFSVIYVDMLSSNLM